MQRTRSKELELEGQLKREKEKITRQEKLLRTISNYEKYLASSRQKQSLLTAKIDEQKRKLLKSAPAISEIKEENMLLDKITQERENLERQIKLAESELKQIKKEKTAIARQIRAHKASVSNKKKKETAKIRKLKQKKKTIEKNVGLEKTQIKKITKRLKN
jgi:hypothetical protein